MNEDAERVRHERSQRLARETVESIRILRQIPSFEGYFMRRLREKQADVQRRILDVSTTPEETTILKRINAEYTILLGLMDSDFEIQGKKLD